MVNCLANISAEIGKSLKIENSIVKYPYITQKKSLTTPPMNLLLMIKRIANSEKEILEKKNHAKFRNDLQLHKDAYTKIKCFKFEFGMLSAERRHKMRSQTDVLCWFGDLDGGYRWNDAGWAEQAAGHSRDIQIVRGNVASSMTEQCVSLLHAQNARLEKPSLCPAAQLRVCFSVCVFFCAQVLLNSAKPNCDNTARWLWRTTERKSETLLLPFLFYSLHFVICQGCAN